MKVTRVIGYIRVSTQEQAREGVSLAAQRTRLIAYAAAMDLELVDIIADEGVSARSLDRPGLKLALAMLRCGEAEGLLIAKLDRLTRRVRDLGQLLEQYFEKSYALVSVSDHIDTRSASGRLMLNVLISVAAWEVETGIERTVEALAEVKAQGGKLGTTPYGKLRTQEEDAHGRRVMVDAPEETAVIDAVRAYKLEGLGVRQIAERLTARGIPTKRGGRQWQPTQVQRILSRATRESV